MSGLCHVLDFYRLGPTDLPGYPTGKTALRVLTDEPTAIQIFGHSPFVKTPDGIRYQLYDDDSVGIDLGEAHRDQCLALFSELNVPLNTPVKLQSGAFSVNDLLAESKASFSFEHREIAWSAIAFARYVPPQAGWTNHLGQLISFDDLVQALLRCNLNDQKCAGLHVFEALILIQNADAQTPILSPGVRGILDNDLKDQVNQIVHFQRLDGSWSKLWCREMIDDPSPMTPFQMSVLVTGHLCEILPKLSAKLQPPEATYLRAAKWVRAAVRSDEIRPDGFWICPYTHAAHGARNILTGEYKLAE